MGMCTWEKDDEAVCFDAHAEDGPPEEDDEDAAEEGGRPLDFVPLEKEPERPLQTYHERQTAQKQYLQII